MMKGNGRSRARLCRLAVEHGWTVTLNEAGDRPKYIGGSRPAPRVEWARFQCEKDAEAGRVRLGVFYENGRFGTAMLGVVTSRVVAELPRMADVVEVMADPECGFIPRAS